MNARTQRQQEASLTAICRKVLSAVPHDEAQSLNAIASEMFRVTRARVDLRVVSGCLNHLLDDGFVKERPPGMFRRVHAALPREDEPMAASTPEAKPDNVTRLPALPPVALPDEPLDDFADIAATLRGLAEAALDLAARVEEAALSAQKRVEQEQAKGARFEKLRKLLAESE